MRRNNPVPASKVICTVCWCGIYWPLVPMVSADWVPIRQLEGAGKRIAPNDDGLLIGVGKAHRVPGHNDMNEGGVALLERRPRR